MHGQTWSEHFKHVLDGLSIFTAVGALVDMLPEVAALFTIIWTGIRIYETETVQKILKKGEADG
jgi:hypothetical protein